MKKISIWIGIVIFITLLAACNQKGVISKEAYKQIDKGMFASEVEDLLGEPSTREEDSIWIYKGKGGEAR